MLKNALKKTLSALTAAAFCFSLAVIPASAVSEKAEPIILPDSRIMLSYMDTLTDDFNRATLSWKVSGGSADALQHFDVEPYNAFEGTRSLMITSHGETVTLSTSDTKTDNSKQLAVYGMSVMIPQACDGAVLTLTLTSAGETFTGHSSLIGGLWQAVCFDVSDAGLSGKLKSVKISIDGLSSGSNVFLDTVGGSSDNDFENALRYSAPYYNDENGNKINDVSSITFNGTEKYIEAENPAVTDFSGGVGIKVRMKNHSSCQTVTLRYTTRTDSEYGDRLSITKEIPDGDGIVSCLFPIPESSIRSFRIYFDGEPTGTAEILSITPAPCYAPPASIGNVSDCIIKSDKHTLYIQGSIDEKDFEKYGDCPVYLYELSDYESVNMITPSTKPKAETILNGNSFSFTFPLSDDKTELYRKYAVMLYYGEGHSSQGSLIPIGLPRTVSNPELLAQKKKAFEIQSLKGISPAVPVSRLDGVGVTSVEIRMDKFLTLSDGEKFSDSICKINKEYLTEIDSLMKQYWENDIGVYMILRLCTPDDNSLREILVHPDCDSETGFAAFNTVSENGVSALKAVTDFLVRRYGITEGVTSNLHGFVVGSEINDAHNNYNMGEKSLLDFARNYSSAFRIVYCAAKSVCAGIDICLPLGGTWNGGTTLSQHCSYDASSCLYAVVSCLEAGGTIDWTLSYDLCGAEDGIFGYEDNDPDLSPETTRITSANLEVLTSALSESEYMQGGVAHSIVFIEPDHHGADDKNSIIRCSAEYIYTYLRICSRELQSAPIKAFIPAHDVSHEDTLSLVDTQKLSDLTESYFIELIGKERCDALLSSAVNAEKRYTDTKKCLTSVPSSIKGKTVLFSFGDSTDGFVPSIGCDSIRFGTKLGSRNGLLSMSVSGDGIKYHGIYRKFDGDYDLTVAPYISADVRPTSLNAETDEIGVAIALFSGKSCCLSESVIKSSEWTTLVCDFSDFPRLDSCDGMAIYLYPVSDEKIGQPTLLVGSISALSDEYSGDDIEEKIKSQAADRESTVKLTTVIAISAVIAASTAILVLRTVSKIRRRKQSGDNEIL